MEQIAQAGGGEAVDVGADIALFVQALESFSAQARACGLLIPDPGGPLDPALVNVVHTPDGGSPTMLPQAAQAAACGADPGWYYDHPNDPVKIHLCPASCDAVEQDPNATIEVAFGCPTVVQ